MANQVTNVLSLLALKVKQNVFDICMRPATSP